MLRRVALLGYHFRRGCLTGKRLNGGWAQNAWGLDTSVQHDAVKSRDMSIHRYPSMRGQ